MNSKKPRRELVDERNITEKKKKKMEEVHVTVGEASFPSLRRREYRIYIYIWTIMNIYIYTHLNHLSLLQQLRVLGLDDPRSAFRAVGSFWSDTDLLIVIIIVGTKRTIETRRTKERERREVCIKYHLHNLFLSRARQFHNDSYERRENKTAVDFGDFLKKKSQNALRRTEHYR